MIREFNRVMQRDVATQFMELWNVLVPMVLLLAADDVAIATKTFLDTYSHHEVSYGMLYNHL